MSVQSAEKALTKARADHEKWQAKLQEAKAEQAALTERHAEAAARVSHGEAERLYAEQDQAEQRQLGVIDKIEHRVATEADKVAEAERKLIEAHVPEEQKLADAAKSRWKQHRDERDRLKAALEEHDGKPYALQPLQSRDPGLVPTARIMPTTATDRVYLAWVTAQARVEVLRFFLRTGVLAKKVGNQGESVTVGNFPQGGRPLKPEEKPAVIYGDEQAKPEAERRPERPVIGGVINVHGEVEPSKIKMGEPTW